MVLHKFIIFFFVEEKILYDAKMGVVNVFLNRVFFVREKSPKYFVREKK
jgi:hypothetical protein